MKTNGWVLRWAAAALFVAPAPAFGDTGYSVASFFNEAETVVASDAPVQCELARCQKCSGPFFFAGTEATLMNVNATTGGRITASFSDTTAPGVSTFATVDGDGINDKFAAAPRLWMGLQLNERWAVVGRYWNLETSNQDTPPAPNPAIPNTGSNFATIFETNRAHLQTADIEIVRSFKPGKWKIDGSLGARQAMIGTESDFLAFGVFTTGNFINLTLQNGFSFNGAGGTTGINVRRQLGDSPFTFFSGFRVSYLGGHTDSFGRSDGTVASSPSAPLVGAATVRRSDADAELDILEYQIGLQMDFPLKYIPANAFFRTALEYQQWDIDGPPTGGAGFGGTIGELTTNSFASAGIGGANLVGLALGCGFTW
ncbi:hypothetical protein [Lacipirellula parvula]|uniref:Uncharacterized protein n=1 Tax=Lacipirellula parvula TaxID=2650471 RepID=A0A5K7X7A6_9BACT|nr:hypothetical protein [Lacipirellula parvula]BBO32480.1 hypothetical protein PLANPX_2092 [Lacipirellula parvula]